MAYGFCWWLVRCGSFTPVWKDLAGARGYTGVFHRCRSIAEKELQDPILTKWGSLQGFPTKSKKSLCLNPTVYCLLGPVWYVVCPSRFDGETTSQHQHQPSKAVFAVWLLSRRRSADEWHQFKQYVWILSGCSIARFVREGCFACSTVAPGPSAIMDSLLWTIVIRFFSQYFFFVVLYMAIWLLVTIMNISLSCHFLNHH